MIKSYKIIFSIILILIFIQSNIFAGETGKIAGNVIDKGTKEFLVGVNIIIMGTTLGASTDHDGNYFILSVPPGIYTIQARMIGYKTFSKTEVAVSADLTTTIDFELENSVIEGEEISIVAERPIVQKDMTSSTRIVDSNELSKIPNAVDINSALKIQPGVVNNHFRGGRSGETRYMIDGVPVENPIVGGYSGINVNKDAIQEMQVITGGFNAEFGQAQSGIVNIITKEGSDDFTFSWDNRSDLLTTENDNYVYSALNLGGPLMQFSNRKLYYFISGHFTANDGYIPWTEKSRTINFMGIDFTGRYNNYFSFNSKLTLAITDNIRLTYGTIFSGNATDPYVHQFKYLPDATTDYNANDKHHYAILNHTLSDRTFFTLRLSHLTHDESNKVNNMNPDEYSNREQFGKIGMDANGDWFIDHLEDQNWSEKRIASSKLKWDITSQILTNHMIKSGIEVTYYNLYELSIGYPGWVFSERDTMHAPGAWKTYGAIRTAYHVFPNIGAFYVQDKMEYQGLIVNAGLRYDYWIPGEQVMNQTALERWEKRIYNEYDPRRGTTKLDKLKDHLSPRLGISYPITDKAMMYISYGKFTQIPPLVYAYNDAAYAGSSAGNPYHLDSEITTAYEFGFTYEIIRDVSLNFKTYNKDVHGLIGMIQAREQPTVHLYVNKDYGTIRGFELELKNRPTSLLYINCNYNYSYAMGRSSDPATELWYGNVYQQPLPMRENRLNWDQRHTLNLVIDLNAGSGEHLHVFGVRLPDLWGINLLYSFGSGLPYTPAFTTDFRKQAPYNSLDKPYTANVDLKINKDFHAGPMYLSVYAEILNLFDKRNINLVNPVTGEPYKFGDYIDLVEQKILNWWEIQRFLDPTYSGRGRRINVGVKLFR